MADYGDPLDAAQQLPAGFSRYIDPTEAAARGLQYTGGNVGWQPFVSPEQATAQGLQYSGGDTTPPNPVYQRFGAIVPEGGGPIMPGTPENIARFGAQTATGPAADALAPSFTAAGARDSYQSALAPIQQRREQIAAQIPSLNRRQAAGAIAQIHALNAQEQGIHQSFAMDQRAQALNQHQLDFEANQRRMLAHESAIESHRQLSTDRETSIDEQGHAMLQGMGQLDAALRNGRIDKDTYDNQLLELGAQYPLATRHPEAARHFEFAITEADKQNAYNQRRELTQAAKLGAKYGIEPQVDPDTGRPSIALTKQAALQTDKGRVEALGLMNREMMAKYGVGTGVGSLFNPIAPHSSDDNGQSIKIPFHDPKAEGGVSTLKVPSQLFDQMKADFNDRYFSLNLPSANKAGAATPTSQNAAPADPRVQLAQRALNDPNASEAHKAAAKRILGLE